MEKLSSYQYSEQIQNAIEHFWLTRSKQSMTRKTTDQGTRSSVTGGKQLDGFLTLLKRVSLDLGVPESSIFTKGNILPGFFRPTKNWDFIIMSPKKKLIAAIELKSQVGSYGNNFNNRIEEALGNAVDLWTAFRENGLPQHFQPWLGYLFLVEKSTTSTRVVKIKEPFYKVRPEFHDTSYMDRYILFCQKLIQERHYTSSALIWSNKDLDFACPKEDISIDNFLLSFMGFIQGKIKEFEA